MTLTLGISGATIILILFLLNQFNKLKNNSFYYDFGNFIGSLLLTVFAYLTASWPFFILNFVWSFFSFRDVTKYFTKKDIIFILDLDNTLYDTYGLSLYNHQLMRKDFPNITEAEHFKAEEMVFPKNNNLYDYSIHAQNLSELTNTDHVKINDWFDNFYKNEPSDRFLYNDVNEFLTWAKSKGKVIILSFGIDKVQKPRIIKSGLAEIVDNYIITQENKGKDVKSILKKYNQSRSDVYFIDDSIRHLDDVKKMNPAVKTFQIFRKKNMGISDTDYKHVKIKNLLELKKYGDFI